MGPGRGVGLAVAGLAGVASILGLGSISGCADGNDASSAPSSAIAAMPSPCKNAGPELLLCADFDDGSVSTLSAVDFGGGTVMPTSTHAVSAPFSLHLRTVTSDIAAAALLLSRVPFRVPQIQVDADVMVVPSGSADVPGADQSSLLRFPVMDSHAAIGAFFVHYKKSTGELFLVAHSASLGDVGRESLGLAPSGFFHVRAEIAPAGGGGAYAQVVVNDRSPQTVTIDDVADGPLLYTLEAGLDAPAAAPFELYLDNVAVRAR
jgi:hypothetical protein